MYAPLFQKKTRRENSENLRLVIQALILLSVCFATTQAQPGRQRDPMRERVRAMETKEMDRLLLYKPLAAAKDDPARRAVLKQIGEDFAVLQSLNNKMMAEAWARVDIDYPDISDRVSQIRGKAKSLKTNLLLPEARDVDKKLVAPTVGGEKEFRAALLLLDKSIMSFVTNPLFQKTSVVEMNLATRASYDLKVIIELSGNLQKIAATLLRKSKNNP